MEELSLLINYVVFTRKISIVFKKNFENFSVKGEIGGSYFLWGGGGVVVNDTAPVLITDVAISQKGFFKIPLLKSEKLLQLRKKGPSNIEVSLIWD